MKKFKHSGTYGDLIYSLALVRHLGGGEFYLHLGQIDWVARHYYGSTPPPVHQGRMTEQDFEQLAPLMQAQSYISKFAVLDPQTTEITDNLDRFRAAFVGHPGNYVDIYASVWGITDSETQRQLRTQPWLTVPGPRSIPNKPYVLNRTARWQSSNCPRAYDELREQGLESQTVFVGTEQEHELFQQQTGWRLDYQPTRDLLDLAEVIAGADEFIGNQSLALSLAIGLGVPYACELRADLPIERNECYFPDQGDYFQ